eukprot:CAMPEP_0174853234 /NCGR_PEP_ID=MMETSP1114-20130205/27548_1 /TAXON_ID=312471 /ORGANISM="Neobodo designis, Strain CCAP 1951/1" /LENGTH=300 /DNA_ID=CAMNT_0016087859 /DNA_START=29 /DNA_END=931 /DNA_ORIENTATION=+
MRLLRTATALTVLALALSCADVTARTPTLSPKTTGSKPTNDKAEVPAAANDASSSGSSGLPRPETPDTIAAAKKQAEAKKAVKEELPVPVKPGAKKPKKKKNKKKKKEKPKEVVDLMLDVAGTMCEKLGGLVKRRKFSVEKRCDLLKFCIEDLTGMFDAMAGEMDLTQQDLVDNALQMHHFMNFQMNMKKVVKMVLADKKPTEKIIGDELNKMMSQWILNVATGQSANSGGNLGKLSREAQKNLRAMGIGLPSYGQMDDDDLEEESALIGDDYSWAEQSNKLAEIYEMEDDDDEDDPYDL